MAEMQMQPLLSFSGPSPDVHTSGEVLSIETYVSLYQIVNEEGYPCFGRINEQGVSEIYLVFEDIDAFSQAVEGVSTVEFRTYEEKLLLIVWTKSDAIAPLGFPLSFTPHVTVERTWLHALLEQPNLELFFLAREQGMLVHIFTEILTLSSNERSGVYQMLQELDERTRMSITLSEEIASRPAMELLDELLLQEGEAYDFLYRIHMEQNQDKAEHVLMESLHQALHMLNKHPISHIREADFLIWVYGDEQTFSIYTSPSLRNLYPTQQDDPFRTVFHRFPAFRNIREISPLVEGAFPIFQREAGCCYHLELNDEVQTKLARLFSRIDQISANPFV
ncbi:hypothetical protein EEL31_13495 [Brevibacillus laterosporus]|uniref:Uncharacterized protein n=1 Tax=Brevibacillus laterosporus TaxID=1465 RepID=A0A518VEY3_BRELA|nr:hypothetical protein [Brevibacillus laterosporus]QDX95509.1 hypothetical protein EEL30_26540 [Brevibacillus laterosporus]TPG69424.1 hypothetical protein EEL31_13495 [Brevibacillus laterosporus]